jgi:nitrate reductase gamma subunit
MMSARLWSLGVFLVAIGIAAHVVGWDSLLWIPQFAYDSLAWIPAAAMDAVRSSPATVGVIALGVVLMVAARIIGRRRRD